MMMNIATDPKLVLVELMNKWDEEHAQMTTRMDFTRPVAEVYMSAFAGADTAPHKLIDGIAYYWVGTSWRVCNFCSMQSDGFADQIARGLWRPASPAELAAMEAPK